MNASLTEYLRDLADWIHHEAFHKLPDELEEKADEVRELAQTLESGVVVVPVELAQRLLKRCREQQLEHERLSEQAADTGMFLSAEAFAAAATEAEADADALEALLSRLQQNGAQTGPPSRYTVTLTDEERQIVCEALSVYTDHCAEYEDHPTAAVRETASTKKLKAWAILSRLQQHGGEER